jgi:mono/diheme cytochrome c family protein
MKIHLNWLCVGLLAATGTSYADSHKEAADRGEHIFAKHCSSCHGDSGDGVEPWYPSLQRLAGMRTAADMVETVLTGRFKRGGELNGHTIPIMPAWGQLSDADVAATVNYIQRNWGESQNITSEDVAKTRTQLWELD